ncbi:MAG TPA: hypothetical protein VF939_23395 [Puia sp.]
MKASPDDKTRLIFLPFLRIAVGFIGVYTLLDWWLVIRTGINQRVDEDIFLLLLPVTLPWIPVLIWLRPRVRLLNLQGRALFFYLLLAVLAIAPPTTFLQEYVETATEKLTALSTISQIAGTTPVKYYTVQQYYVAKEWAQAEDYSTTGDKNHSFTFHYYIVAPLFDKPGVAIPFKNESSSGEITDRKDPYERLPDSISTVRAEASKNSLQKDSIRKEEVQRRDSLVSVSSAISQAKAWIGIYYTQKISNRLDIDEKDALRKEFLLASWKDFLAKDFNKAVYLERMYHRNDRKEYEYTLAVSPSPPTGSVQNLTILEARWESLSQRNGNRLIYGLLAFTLGSMIWGFILLFYRLEETIAKPTTITI